MARAIESETPSVGQVSVAATVEQKRFGFPGLGLLDLTNIYRVIAALVCGDDLAFEIGQHPVQDRRLIGAHAIADALEFISASGREPARKVFLVGGEKINREALTFFEAGIVLRLLVDADQYQRRHQRSRGEGIY